MGYNKADGRYVDSAEAVTLLASGARTASGNGSAVEVGGAHTLRAIILAITAASGTTPTLDVIIQTSNDGSTWSTVPAGAGATATGVYAQQTGTATITKISLVGLGKFVRVNYTIGGTTPSFTFSVVADFVGN